MGGILTCIPYDLGGNLGAAYNNAMQAVGHDGWVCFLDHDAIWTTNHWYAQLNRAVSTYPKAGLFTAVTNRIGNKHQLAPGAPQTHDMRLHRAFGEKLASRHGHRAVDVTDLAPVSGVVLLLSKRAWKSGGPAPSGLLGVDNAIHAAVRKAGYRVMILQGLYVYHWYRGDGSMKHLHGKPKVRLDKKWWRPA
jgi:GT2 family glycosyltransferase